jgi:hypothetical protein
LPLVTELSLLVTKLSPILAELSLLVVELSPLVAELSLLVAELLLLLVAELSLLVAELSPLKPRLQPCSRTGLANTSCLRPPSTLYSLTTRPVRLLDHPTSARRLLPRPPDQCSGIRRPRLTLCSGTASTTLRPQLEAHSSRPDFLGYM